MAYPPEDRFLDILKLVPDQIEPHHGVGAEDGTVEGEAGIIGAPSLPPDFPLGYDFYPFASAPQLGQSLVVLLSLLLVAVMVVFCGRQKRVYLSYQVNETRDIPVPHLVPILLLVLGLGLVLGRWWRWLYLLSLSLSVVLFWLVVIGVVC